MLTRQFMSRAWSIYKKHFFDSGFRGKAYYYFSPQFRLEASAEIGYQVTNKEAGPDRWEGTYMLTLNYSFF